MPDMEKVIKGLECCAKDDCSINDVCPYGKKDASDCLERLSADALAMIKEQEDLMELIHNKNERIKKLEEQLETLTKWRMNAGAFD